MTEIKEKKKQIRDEVKAGRLKITGDEKSALDGAILRRFLSLASYRYSQTLLLYAPLSGEIDVMPLAKAAWESGRRVAFPRCRPEDNAMTFYFVSSPDELSPAHFGIREPSPDAEPYDPESPDLTVCVIPALAFDRDGFRVGYGGGFYDRFLNDFRGAKVGLVYERFLIPRAPRGRFDTAADAIVTEKGVITPCRTGK